MTERKYPYIKRMWNVESYSRVFAEIPESLHVKFKHVMFDKKMSQKKAVTEAIILWLDNQNTLKLTCMICGKLIDYTGFPVLSGQSFESAVNDLKKNMLCENPECIIEFERTHDIDNYNALFELHKNDKWDFRDAIWKSWEQNK